MNPISSATRGQAFVISKVDSPFPEPGFSTLQRQVFADIQQGSAQLALAIAAERKQRESIPGSSRQAAVPIMRFGALAGDQLVGWSYGWFEPDGAYYMANSGVSASHRRRGVYSALLEASIEHARTSGAPVVRSRHSVLNNAVIICKLQRGFHINGLGMTAHLGLLVELVQHLSSERHSLFRSRVIPFDGAGAGADADADADDA